MYAQDEAAQLQALIVALVGLQDTCGALRIPPGGSLSMADGPCKKGLTSRLINDLVAKVNFHIRKANDLVRVGFMCGQGRLEHSHQQCYALPALWGYNRPDVKPCVDVPPEIRLNPAMRAMEACKAST